MFATFEYPNLSLIRDNFELEIEAGTFTQSELIVLLGKNGTGKTSFIKILAGKLKSNQLSENLPQLTVSYKPQEIEFKPDVVISFLILSFQYFF